MLSCSEEIVEPIVLSGGVKESKLQPGREIKIYVP